MQNIRRMLGVLLALCMVLTMLPVRVSAAEPDVLSVQSSYPEKSPFISSDSFLVNKVSSFQDRRTSHTNSVSSESDTDAPLTALTIGNTDAMITTRGKGWRLNKSTGVLTLSGASISGVGDYGIEAVGTLTIEVQNGTRNTISGNQYGIYVDGNLNIRGSLTAEGASSEGTGIYASGSILLENCPNLIARGGLEGLISGASIDIRNSSVTASADLSLEDFDSGLLPCGLFAADQLTVRVDSVLNASSAFSGIDVWTLDAQDSTLNGTGGYYGIYCNTAQFQNCRIDAEATVSSADITLDSPEHKAVGLYGSQIEISGSELDLLGGTAGILGDEPDSSLILTDSQGSISGGYLACGTMGDVSISDCTLALSQTLSMTEAMGYADFSGAEILPGGILSPAEDGTMEITDTTLEITGGTIQIGADSLLLEGVTADLTGGAYGIAGISAVSLTNCPAISVAASNNALNGFVNAGGTLPSIPACISANGPITVSGCDQVSVQGSWIGITSNEANLTLEDSAVLASGGYAGLIGKDIVMTRADVQARGTWTATEAAQYGTEEVFALISSEGFILTETTLEEGTLGLYNTSDGNTVCTALDSNGSILTTAVFTVAQEEPEPTDPSEPEDGIIATGWSGATQWTLTEDGVLTVYGEGNMANYGWNGGQPWLDKGVEITSVVVEEGVTSIGTGAFKDLTTLESVTLPETGLTKIGEAAFYGCSSLKELHIPDGVYTIWEYVFKNCTALEKIRLPRTLEKIDQGAFENCSALSYVFFPGNLKIIGGWSFKGCTNLAEVDMQWADATTIRAGAFKNCYVLATIHLPADIQVLGDSCFYGIGAEKFVVPTTVTEIQAWCFARASVKEIIFEGNAPVIGEGAFNKITLTASYPNGNATWTEEVMHNYGGTVTWTAK